MAPLTTASIYVTSQEAVEAVRRAARRIAASAGLVPSAVEETVIVASELATNVLKHAEDGVISLSVIDAQGQEGVEIESRDRGPGIPDVEAAFRDGFSSGGGIGAGLGSVRRLSDSCEIETGPNGTLIKVRKWPRRR